MIIGTGIDIIELDRIEKSLRKNSRIVQKILTEAEQQHFKRLHSFRRKIEFLAGRFAAKEAVSKATGQGIGKLSFQHIEILPNEKGAPMITVVGLEEKHIHLSISHSSDYAAAQVIIEQR